MERTNKISENSLNIIGKTYSISQDN